MRLSVIFVVWWLALSLSAQPGKTKKSVAEGVIVSLDDKELIVDLGSAHGLPARARVKVYRRLDVIHPVTKQALVDRFFIGEIELEEVGQKLSICRAWSELERPPKPADFVVYEPILPTIVAEPSKVTPEPQPSTLPVAPLPAPKDPAKEAVELAFAASLGKPMTERIQIWEEYLRAYPNSEFRDTVGKELVWLRQRLEEERNAKTTPKPANNTPTPAPPKIVALNSRVSAPQVVEVGSPLAFAVSLTNPEFAAEVRLLLRREGEPGFETIPLQRDGDAYWRAIIPQEWVTPGVLEYFIEGVRTDNEIQRLMGYAASPMEIKIIDPPDDILDETNRSTSSTSFEFVDFKTGNIQDHFFRLTSDYRYRVGVGVLDAFRLGVGLFNGTGGSITDLQNGQSFARNVNFGYAELELGLHRFVGLSGRLLLGSQSLEQQEQVPVQSFFALRSELRIGEEQGTRLLLGNSLNQDIGNETWIELAFNVNDKLPMSGSVVLTNLPIGEARGVSLKYGAGWKFKPWFQAMLSVGLNARTITHFGLTTGSSLVFTW